MRTLIQVILAIAAVIIIPTIGLLIYLSLADLSVHKEYFEDEISEGLGHQVSIGGLFDLQVGGQIVFTAENVSASNPEWAENDNYLNAERIHIVIDAWSMTGDSIEIDEIDLVGVNLNLHEDDAGRGNWEPNLTEMQTVAVEYEDDDDISVVLHKLTMASVGVAFEKAGNAAQELTIDSLQVNRDANGSTSVQSVGAYTDGTLTIPFNTAGAINLDTANLQISDTTIGIVNDSLVVDGSVGFGGTSNLNIAAEGPDLSALGDTFGVNGLPGQAYRLTAHLLVDPNTIALDDLKFAIGEGEINGSLAVELSQGKPHLFANLNSPLLDLRVPESATDDAENANSDVNEVGAESTMIFGDEPLAVSWLDSVNINAEASITRIFLPDDQLENFSLSVALDDGALTIEPLRFDSGDGDFSATLDLRPSQEKYSLSVAAEMNDLRFGALAVEGQAPESIPPLNLGIKIDGEGTTIHEIMSSSNGNLSGRQGQGQINMQAAGVLFSDLVTSILRTLNPLAETESVTNLECGVYEVNIVNGVATIEQMALQTERLTIVSSGNIDFSTEVIDMTLGTKTREGLGVSLGGVVNSFLKVGGTLNDPSMGVDAAGSATTTGAAVATGGLSLLARGLWDRVSAEADICAQPEASESGDAAK